MQALVGTWYMPELSSFPRIIAIMESPAKEDDTALRAANLIIERSYGKAPQEVEVENYDVDDRCRTRPNHRQRNCST